MKARLLDLAVSLTGKQRLTVELDGDFRSTWGELNDTDCEITVKKYRKRRSLDANAMMWSVCEQIAKKIGSTKEEVYRQHIKEVGIYTPLPIKEKAVEDFANIWSAHGTGWFVEVVDNSKLPGYKLVFAYAGSSTYDTKEMSRLIDSVVQDAKSIGIDVMSEQERSLLLNAWSGR